MKKILIALVAAISFSACSTEIEVNAEWKDVTVVFGLLDVSDTIQYIKISKAFLGEEDAFVMAQEPDSLYYSPGAITAVLEEYKNGNLTKTIVLNRDETVPKDSGVFASPNQVIYSTTEPLDQNASYKLVINKGNDPADVVTAETQIVNTFSWKGDLGKPFWEVHFAGSDNTAEELYFQTAQNGRLYETHVRFYYMEESRFDKSDTVLKFVDWKLDNITSSNLEGTQVLGNDVVGSNFYRLIDSRLDPDPTVWRHPRHIDVSVYVASDEFATYLNVNQPSSSIAQERPTYTNIENGEGLLGSRISKIREGVELTHRSHDSLQCGRFTNDLSFVSYFWDNVNDVHIDTIRICQ